MELSQIIEEGCISFDVDLHTKEEVFEYLVNQLLEVDVISSKEKFLKALYYRETLSETGIGGGIAIPHGKDDCVNQASIAFVRLLRPIEWESMDDKPVQFVFLLAIPNSENNEIHLRMLSELARSLIKKEVIEKVEKAKTSEEFLKVI